MSFEDIQFSDEIKTAIKKMNYDKATNVQLDTIPLILEGHNVIVQSHTGSGKTAAFGIPISELIFTGKIKACLILCPTRELAIQVKDEIKRINSKTRLKVTAFYGGHGMSVEEKQTRMGIDILCATPGRLLDHFRSNKLDPMQFETLVLDEADRMLDMGFINDLREIIDRVDPVRMHLFSATLAGNVANIIQEFIPEYEEIIVPGEVVGTNIIERHIKVPREKRITALIEILEEAKDERVLVFVSTKRTADFLAKKLYQEGYSTESIHGDKTQKRREHALADFREGKRRVLVATDVAARGLQIDNVEYVVNYDLANDADTHKHRIGRTGRMGKKGCAISFVGSDDSVIAPPKRFGRGSGGRGNSSNNRGRSFGNSGRDSSNRRDSSTGRSGSNFKNRSGTKFSGAKKFSKRN